jgi:DNA-binding NtrC family response regulator
MKILLADKDAGAMRIFADMLSDKGHDVTLVSNGDQAIKFLRDKRFDLFLMQIDLPITDGFKLLSQIREEKINITVISIVEPGEFLKGRKSIEAGGFSFLVRPLSFTSLDNAIKNAFKAENLIKKLSYIHPEYLCDFKRIDNLYEAINRYKIKKGNVLILSPFGGGADYLSELIHMVGEYRDRPVGTIDCSINKVLFQRYFAGYKKRSFLGAKRDFKGLACKLRGGSIILKNLDKISSSCADYLEECIFSRSYVPLGASNSEKLELNFISIAEPDFIDKHSNLSQKLFNYLSESRFMLPQLKNVSNLDSFIFYLYESFAQSFESDAVSQNLRIDISDQDLAKLNHYSWPGNISELELVIKLHSLIGKWRIFEASDTSGDLYSETPFLDDKSNERDDKSSDRLEGKKVIDDAAVIEKEGLPVFYDVRQPKLFEQTPAESILTEENKKNSSNIVFTEKMKYSQAKDLFEKTYIDFMLNIQDGNVTNTAKIMGIGRRTLQEKMKRHGIESGLYRGDLK